MEGRRRVQSNEVRDSVSASFAGRKEERDRDRSSEGEAVLCRLHLQSRRRSGHSR